MARTAERVMHAHELLYQEPTSVRQAQNFMTRIGEAIADTNRRLGDISQGGTRIMNAEGRFLTRGEVADLRSELIEAKDRLIARQQTLRSWRNERVRDVRAGKVLDADVPETQLNVNVRNMRAAARRYLRLETVYERASEYVDVSASCAAEDAVDIAFESLVKAIEALDEP